MNIIHVVVLSIVEGITEFLPVSSTFHLILTAKLLSISQNSFVELFEVFIQAGAILSVVLLYFQSIIKDRELMKKTFVSFVPTAVVGLVLYKMIKTIFFNSPYVMVGVFIFFGIIFLILEYLVIQKKIKLYKEIKSLTYKQAALIGLVQSLAVIPGVSRAGAVIVSMMVFGYKREESARYSFILSIPTVFAASFYDLYKMRAVAFDNLNNAGLLALGFIGAFVCSYFVVKWLLSYLQRNSLALFGWYRVVLGIILLIFRI